SPGASCPGFLSTPRAWGLVHRYVSYEGERTQPPWVLRGIQEGGFHEIASRHAGRNGLLPRLTITDESVDVVACAPANCVDAASRVKDFIVLSLLIFLRHFIPHHWDTPVRHLFERYHANQALFYM